MKICYSVVSEFGPDGEPVWVVTEGDEVWCLVHESLASDVPQMFRLLSLAVTRYAQQEWIHVGNVVGAA